MTSPYSVIVLDLLTRESRAVTVEASDTRNAAQRASETTLDEWSKAVAS
jgi:hypothetical protein